MISNEEFIRQSIESNLIYCTSILEYTYSLGFSFLQKEQDIINEIENFYNKFKNQILKTINIANKNISQELIDSNILYTKYTLPLYELTEELTGDKGDTDIITKIMMLKSGITTVSTQLLNEVKTINTETLKILKEYIDFITYINNQVLKSNLFAYKYGLFIEEVKNRAIFYYENLSRIINKEKVSTTLVDKNIDELRKQMEQNALFINGFVNQSENNVIKQARDFVNDFSKLNLNNILNLPEEERKTIYNDAMNLINSFINFITKLIERQLNRNIQFIVGPAYLDICLKEANSFKYNLNTLL